MQFLQPVKSSPPSSKKKKKLSTTPFQNNQKYKLNVKRVVIVIGQPWSSIRSLCCETLSGSCPLNLFLSLLSFSLFYFSLIHNIRPSPSISFPPNISNRDKILHKKNYCSHNSHVRFFHQPRPAAHTPCPFTTNTTILLHPPRIVTNYSMFCKPLTL